MFGYIQNTPDSRDLTVGVHLDQEVGLPTDLPDYSDLRDFEHPVLNQKSTSSCVAHAAAQVLYGTLNVQGIVLPEIPSVMWLYRKSREQESRTNLDQGTTPRAMMQGIQKCGFCLEQYWPFNAGEVLIGPTALAGKHAYDQRLKTQYYVCSEDQKQRLLDIKRTIVSKRPLMLAFSLDQAFLEGKFSVWELTGPVIGRHMLACFGYTPDGIIITNSWGPYWNTQGHAIIGWETVLRADVCTDPTVLNVVPAPTEMVA